MKKVLLLIGSLALFYTALLIRDVPRHGSVLRAIDSWIYVPSFDLRSKDHCYELRRSEHGLFLLKIDPNAPPKKYPHLPDGSVMRVDSTKFDPQPHLDECRQYKGYFITRNYRTEWVLTSVK